MRKNACGGILILAAALSWSCGANSVTTPSNPTPTPTDGSGVASPLPLGQASAVDSACPSGSPSGSTCTRVVVSCPAVAVASAVVRVTRPAAGAATRGTVVLVSGGDGTRFTSDLSSFATAMVATMLADGVVVADVAWDPPGVWGGPKARTLACRAATAFKWVNDNVHAGGRSKMFAAQGTSGGSSQIAFALAHYGVDFIDLANLGSGPPRCPPLATCVGDATGTPEPLLPSVPPAENRAPRLAYPSTVVRIFVGDQEATPEIVVDARAYYDAITTAKFYTTVPGTNHHIEDSQNGVNAFIGSVRSAIR